MALTPEDVTNLSSRLTLGKDHGFQEKAVAAALTRLLVEEKRGVVLADEVGFGKTYEALAVMALLSERAREARKAFDRVLVSASLRCLESGRRRSARRGLTEDFPGIWSATHGTRTIRFVGFWAKCTSSAGVASADEFAR